MQEEEFNTPQLLSSLTDNTWAGGCHGVLGLARVATTSFRHSLAQQHSPVDSQ
jgi:hypothetical protein